MSRCRSGSTSPLLRGSAAPSRTYETHSSKGSVGWTPARSRPRSADAGPPTPGRPRCAPWSSCVPPTPSERRLARAADLVLRARTGTVAAGGGHGRREHLVRRRTTAPLQCRARLSPPPHRVGDGLSWRGPVRARLRGEPPADGRPPAGRRRGRRRTAEVTDPTPPRPDGDAEGQRCSDLARGRQDDLAGSALPTRAFLLVEEPGSWGAEPHPTGALPPAVVAELHRAGAGALGPASADPTTRT